MGDPDGEARAKALETLALLSMLRGDAASAVALYKRAADAYEQAGLPAMVAHCHLNMATALEADGDSPAAITSLEEARRRFDDLGLSKEVAMSDTNLGNTLIGLDRAKEARAALMRARDAFVRDGLLKELAQCEMGISRLHFSQSDFDTASESYAAARAIAIRLGDEELLAWCEKAFESLVDAMENALSISRKNQWRFAMILASACAPVLAERFHAASALQLLDRAKALFKRVGTELDVANTEKAYGNTLCLAGKPLEGLECYDRAMKVFEEHGWQTGIAACEMGRGGAFYLLSQHEQAIRCYLAARYIFESEGDEMAQADCDKTIGQAYLELGRSDRAIEHMERALARFRLLNAELQTARCELGLGTFLLYHDHARAFELLSGAHEYFLGNDLLKEAADCDTALGCIGPPQERMAHQERARDMYRRLGLRREAANCEMNIGTMEILGRDCDQGLERLRAAAAEYAAMGLKKELGECHATIGEELLRRSRFAARESRDEILQEALFHLTTAIEAIEAVRAMTFDLDSRFSLHDRYADVYELAVVACIELGEVLAAFNDFERAKAKQLGDMVSRNLFPERSDVGPELYERFVSARVRVVQKGFLPNYSLAVPVGENAGPAGRVPLTPEEIELREALEGIRTQCPESNFARLLERAQVELRSEEDFRALIPDRRSGLLEFFASDQRLHAFLITQDHGVELVTFPEKSGDRLNDLVRSWRTVFDDVDPWTTADVVWAGCREAHRQIFEAPILLRRDRATEEREAGSLRDYLESVLHRGEDSRELDLCIVPHLGLSLLPLHAAFQPRPEAAGSRVEEVRFLIESFSIVYAPSAHLFGAARQRVFGQEEETAILVADPRPIPGWQPLPYAVPEVRLVREHLSGAGWKAELLEGERATKEAFLTGSVDGSIGGISKGSYSHQHLAQHAAYDPSTRAAYLCFSAFRRMAQISAASTGRSRDCLSIRPDVLSLRRA